MPSAVAALLLALWACAAAASPPERVLVDGEGVPVTVPLRPQRIVAAAPDLAEMLVDVGAGDALVGACDECDRPPVVARLPRIGPMVQPSVEAILALRPDLVLVTSRGNPHDIVGRLRTLGLPVFGIDPRARGMLGVLEQARDVGVVAGRPADGERVAADLADALARARERSAGRKRPTACVLIWVDPIVSAGGGSFVEDILDAAGADNACRLGTAEYPRVSREDLLLAAPDMVLVATGDGTPGSPADLGAWAAGLPAVRAGRALHVDPALLLRPTRRLLEAIEVVQGHVAAATSGPSALGP